MASIPTQVVPSVHPSDASVRTVRREFRDLVDRGRFLPVGEAKGEPRWLLDDYAPRHRVDLFDTRFYFTDVMKNPAVRFFVAYVVKKRRGREEIHPRIFYKDISLVWRVASHVVATENLFWIGKGLVEDVRVDGHEEEHSIESTTDLPLELQHAIEQLSRRSKKVKLNDDALYLVLRSAPESRIAPYEDFSAPFAEAAKTPGNRIHGGRRIARFRRKGDPTSLTIVKGFEPDFRGGLIDATDSYSASYGGPLRKFRVLSKNQRIQWLFFTGDTHVWVVPPQALTTELSTYGVRTVHVYADDLVFVPGYEYHFVDETAHPDDHFSQIPEGFVGQTHEQDPDRADASAWIEELPIVKELRRTLL